MAGLYHRDPRTRARSSSARTVARSRTLTATSDDRFETDSPAFRTLLQQAARVAATEVPILLRGESGTGKNVLARWLWQRGARKDGPFVAVNCINLKAELEVSHLHEKTDRLYEEMVERFARVERALDIAPRTSGQRAAVADPAGTRSTDR